MWIQAGRQAGIGYQAGAVSRGELASELKARIFLTQSAGTRQQRQAAEAIPRAAQLRDGQSGVDR